MCCCGVDGAAGGVCFLAIVVALCAVEVMLSDKFTEEKRAAHAAVNKFVFGAPAAEGSQSGIDVAPPYYRSVGGDVYLI